MPRAHSNISLQNFTPVPTPAGDYGKFHEGDSYIVLQTSRDPETEKLKWDIYFWLGKDTTQVRTDVLEIRQLRTRHEGNRCNGSLLAAPG